MPKKGKVPPHLRKFLFKKKKKRTRRAKSSSSRGVSRRTVKNVARRSSRRRRGRGGRKTMGIASTLASLNAAAQFAEPLIPAAQAALSGNLQGAVGAFKAGAKEAVSGANLAQALVPVVAVGAAKRIAGMLGIPNRRVGRSKFTPL